ncbi:N-acetylneuraminate synthase [Paenibacillus sp. FSL W7-1287]|uniref:N-acetylneuraminate synthase n=1 Tax=Paenibacillus sp. FSL W7-1287 TaxID=2954538 RepID=UPI0030FC544B
MTYIIAEAGVNHNGSLELAQELALVAKQAGADAVKFQTFKAEKLVTKKAVQANYQIHNLGEATSQFTMLKNLELSFEEFTKLKDYCAAIGIEFLSTPFDYESVDFLVRETKMPSIKISSSEITNLPFIYYIAIYKKPIIISTGMATIEEIDDALAYIAYGLAGKKEMGEEHVDNFYQSNEAKLLLNKYVTILHCTTEYPAPFDTINLKAMEQLRSLFNVKIGLSDHSEGIAVPIAAVALGAEVIEKHFTLDKKMHGPDHVASLAPDELKNMINHIREIEQALGHGTKRPSDIELLNRAAVRKSIVASSNIAQGEVFTKDNLTIKRPGTGMNPSLYWGLIGKKATKPYYEDELIDE